MKHKVEPKQLSALRFERVWVREATFVDQEGEHDPARAEELQGVEIQLDVRATFSDSGNRAHVTLRAVLEPPPEKRLFAKLAATVEGVFTLRHGSNQELLARFASLQAPVLLVPYLREVLTSLTAQSRLGPVLLPPLNMAGILKAMQAQATQTPAPAATK